MLIFKKTVAMIVALAVAASAFAQKTEQPKPKKAPDAVGDIVFKDGTALPMQRGMMLTDEQRSNVVAVIAFVGDGVVGKKGLVYGLGVERSDYYQTWAAKDSFGATTSFDSIANNTQVKVSAKNAFDPNSGDIDGSDNWEEICKVDPNATTKPAVNYPVFNYANNYGKKNNFKGELATGWYVPTVTEFTVIYNNMNDIHAAIASMNKEVSLYETALWTSSQCSTDPTKVYAITTTTVNLASKNYLSGGHVLVLHTFGKAIEEEPPKQAKKNEKAEAKEEPKPEPPKVEKETVAQEKPQSSLIFTATNRPAAKVNYSALDKEVKALSFRSTDKISDAAKKITASSQTTKQKARALFTWICNNVKFDKDNKKESSNVKGVWATGYATSEGYSLLFKQMAKDAGIKADSVSGEIKKNVAYKPGDALEKHFWNVVYDGKTPIIIDIAMTVANGTDYVTEYFDVDPGLFVFSHFTKSGKAQGLNKAVDKKLFEKMPYLSLRLGDLGISGQDVVALLQAHKDAGFPETTSQIKDVADMGIKINKLPMTKTLGSENYIFNFEFPQNVTIQLVTPKGNQKMTSGKDCAYAGSANGTVKVQITKSGKTYTLFNYESKVQ